MPALDTGFPSKTQYITLVILYIFFRVKIKSCLIQIVQVFYTSWFLLCISRALCVVYAEQNQVYNEVVVVCGEDGQFSIMKHKYTIMLCLDIFQPLYKQVSFIFKCMNRVFVNIEGYCVRRPPSTENT